MANQFTIPNIPPAQDIDSLRLSITNAMSKLVGQLNAAPTTLDGQNQRVQNVATPTGPNDAVNKRYLHGVLAGNTLLPNRGGQGGGKDAYTIVFSDSSTVGAGDVIPVFVVGQDRVGVPIEVWLYAVQAPGTGGLVINVTKNTSTNVLSTALTLTSGSNGPVYSYSFTGGIKFNHGDVIAPVISTAASPSVVSIGVVVRRT